MTISGDLRLNGFGTCAKNLTKKLAPYHYEQGGSEFLLKMLIAAIDESCIVTQENILESLELVIEEELR